jgi:hypothetical protein
MLEYVKAAIGEGYQPENEEAITDLSLIDALNDNDLNREFGKCWQWWQRRRVCMKPSKSKYI